jgi:hypothetical protein
MSKIDSHISDWYMPVAENHSSYIFYTHLIPQGSELLYLYWDIPDGFTELDYVKTACREFKSTS